MYHKKSIFLALRSMEKTKLLAINQETLMQKSYLLDMYLILASSPIPGHGPLGPMR